MIGLIALYLGAAVLANLTIAHFGPAASIIVAFVCIGLNITVRDKIHDRWAHDYQLWVRMLVLVCTGGLLSYVASPGTEQVALASLFAFIFSEFTDALVYQAMHEAPWIIRSNTSNIFSAIVDSLIFPTVAFGKLLPAIILGQFAAKLFGGFIWSLILKRRQHHISAHVFIEDDNITYMTTSYWQRLVNLVRWRRAE